MTKFDFSRSFKNMIKPISAGADDYFMSLQFHQI